MSITDKIVNQIKKVKNGESNLFSAYQIFWENTPNLKPNELDDFKLKLKEIDSQSAKSASWQALSDAIRCVFFPNHGKEYDSLMKALELFTANNDKEGEGAAQSLLAIYYKNLGQLDKAQELVQQSLTNINEHPDYLYFLTVDYYQAGEIYKMLKDYDAAIMLYTKGLDYVTETTEGMVPRLLNGIGTVYCDKKEFEKAFNYFNQSLQKLEGKNHGFLESKNYADIGNYYYQIGDYEKSFLYQQKSVKIRKENKHYNALITNYLELAELFFKQNKLDDALEYALLAEKNAIEFKIIIKQYQAELIASSIYEAMNNKSLALEYYKKYHVTKDFVLGQENARKLQQIKTHNELDSMQKEKEIFKLRNVVLKEALDEISASVRYAKRIQEAILPPIELIKEKLPNSFVLYKPKDVVAGDFYWMEEINDSLFIAAADCTGHGVPGALVSVVCSNALNRAVKEFKLTETGKILDKVCLLVCETFENSSAEVKDGMDISLLCINKKNKQITWSGANNPLWYFIDSELKTITATKRPIGKSDNHSPFITHIIEYKKDTSFYLFTDGYADQFGGEKGKKFMYKQFQELLFSMLNKNVNEQHTHLNTAFENWKGNLEQVDDVCVIGIRV